MAIACSLFATLSILIIPLTPKNHSVDRTYDYLGPIIRVAGLISINEAWNQAQIAATEYSGESRPCSTADDASVSCS